MSEPEHDAVDASLEQAKRKLERVEERLSLEDRIDALERRVSRPDSRPLDAATARLEHLLAGLALVERLAEAEKKVDTLQDGVAIPATSLRLDKLEAQLSLHERLDALERRSPTGEPRSSVAVPLGLLVLGLVVGSMAAFSETPVVGAILAAFFALLGGSVGAFVEQVKVRDRGLVGWMVFALSLGTLVGIYGGAAVQTNHLLGEEATTESEGEATERSRYLRSGAAELCADMSMRLSRGEAADEIIRESCEPPR